MICRSCGSANPDAALFCGACGQSLTANVTCPVCGTSNPPDNRFCGGCGRPLTAAVPREEPAPAPPPPGERKQVTVAFLDVEGSMRLTQTIDPEVWRAVMDRFLAVVSEGVERYEGTVASFTGDGAMALFGAPVAYEDHALRACYAALNLRDALAELANDVKHEHGLSFSIRMGLNSGEVVAGAVGVGEGHAEYTAIGHTVGLAARMEALADPGRPYLTRGTAALVDGWFELEDVGEMRVKGLSEPVAAYALLGARHAHSRVEAAAERGLSRFVGRERELARLGAALERAAGDSGQVVGIVGEAGLGKSRLCHEFAGRCRARGIQVTVGAGVPHGRRVPLLPVIEMLRAYFGIQDDPDDRAAREKVAGRLLLLDESFRDALAVIFDFLGIPDPDRPAPQISPEARQRTLFAALRQLIHAAAQDRVTVAIVEDVHWLDPGSEAFLHNLVDSVAGSHALLVANFRPEYRADWMQRSSYESIALEPLDAQAIAALVADLVGDDPSLDGMAELVAARTDGNPFFIEEVVQGLAETAVIAGERGAYRLVRPIEEIEIPATVQAVLAARIDRLGARDKAVLQTAAVIGREFSEPVLREIATVPERDVARSLATLSRAQLVTERSLYPEALYAFKHPLTQEVAYRSQLSEPRAATHAAVARALERLYPVRLDELAGVIGNHLQRAGDPEAAAAWIARAAMWAGQAHPAEALRHWRRVRALLRDRAPSSEVDGLKLAACLWTLQFGWRLGLRDDEVRAVYAEARALARARDNHWGLSAARMAYGIARGMVGEVREAYECASAGRTLASELGDLELMVSTGDYYWLLMQGRHHEALARADEQIALCAGDFELGRRTFGISSLILATMLRGLILTELGRFEEARAGTGEALRLSREHGDVENVGWALAAYPQLEWFTGELRDGVARGREGVELAERLGSPFSQLVACTYLARGHLARREWNEALSVAREALALMRSSKTGLQYEPQTLATVAEALLGVGDVAGARDRAAEAVALAEPKGNRAEVHARWQLGRALMPNRPAEARAQLAAAIERCGDEHPATVPLVRESLAEVARVQGDETARRRELEAALERYDAMGASGHARRLRAALGAVVA